MMDPQARAANAADQWQIRIQSSTVPVLTCTPTNRAALVAAQKRQNAVIRALRVIAKSFMPNSSLTMPFPNWVIVVPTFA